MTKSNPKTYEDPLSWLPRIATKLHSLWLRWTYRFISLGTGFSAHYSCELGRSAARHMQVGNDVNICRDAWLSVPGNPQVGEPIIVLEDGCNIGRDVEISAKNGIHLERNIGVAGHVLIMDHNHAYEDVTVPIVTHRGLTEGGTIRIGEGSWIGFGAVIVCTQGELVIGRHCVVAANSLVTRSIPPYSVVAGNPARVVRYYDPSTGTWIMGSRGSAGKPTEHTVMSNANTSATRS